MRECILIGNLDQIPEAMKVVAKNNDIIITLGAGPITEAAPIILRLLNNSISPIKNSLNGKFKIKEKIA